MKKTEESLSADARIVKSVCSFCTSGCGLLVTMQEGKPVKIKGDLDHPVSCGFLCRKGLASLEFLNHPERLRHPLKRVGVRGKGHWQEISWDEAFSLAGNTLKSVKKKYGPESVAMVQGSAKGQMDTLLKRMANAFGTPNLVASDPICHMPRVLAELMTIGFFPGSDWDTFARRALTMAITLMPLIPVLCLSLPVSLGSL